MRKNKKVVIIGAGHNSLVTAAYLAKAGYKVQVLESRSNVGGAASTEAMIYGGETFLFSTASYLVSMFLKEIVKDLELERHGYKVLRRNPSSCTPTPDGKVLLLGPDMAFNQAQIAQFSPRDAAAYPRYEHQLGEIGKWTSQMLTMVPPSGLWPRNWRDVKALLALAFHALRLNPVQMQQLAKLLFTDPVKYLDSWFESPVLKATLLTDSMIGTANPSGIVLLHHVMGDAGGAQGVWGYMEGGMGAISKALAAAGKEHGVEIILNARVHKIMAPVKKGSPYLIKAMIPIKGASGSLYVPEFFKADIVVSGVDPSITFGKLLADEPRVNHWRGKVLVRKSKGVSMKINIALKGPPNLRAMPTGPDGKPGPQHQGTIHIAPSVEYIRAALRDYEGGRSSSEPILEISIPSAVDRTLAPAGKHVMNIFVQFVRFGVDKEAYWRDVILPTLRKHISNIDEILISVQVLAPRDIEEMFGMPGGNIFHGEMDLYQLLCRPVPGLGDYRVPELDGLYECGAGTYPGGSVCGASGYNVARIIIEEYGVQN